MSQKSKNIVQITFDMFRRWFDDWLETKPSKELLQIAHSQLGKLYQRVGKELKANER